MYDETKISRRDFISRAANIIGISYLASPLELIAAASKDWIKDRSIQDLLAMMLCGEISNKLTELDGNIEPYVIAYTAINRINDGVKWNGENLREVLLAKNQYTCFNPTDKNYHKIINASAKLPKEWKNARLVAELVLKDALPYHNEGQTHYHLAGSEPRWAKSCNMERISSFDDKNLCHVFYKEIS